jgi:hypothetical protein
MPEIPFSSFNLVCPEPIQKIRKTIIERQLNFDYIDYILDKNLITGIIHEIQYFRRLKMVSEEFCELLKAELKSLVNKMAQEIETGIIKGGKRCNYYLSWLDVENNSIFADCEVKQFELYFNYGSSILKTSNTKNSITSGLVAQKKFAVLITQSNDFIRSDFIGRMYAMIETLDENNFKY